jgi:hypothetical protein
MKRMEKEIMIHLKVGSALLTPCYRHISVAMDQWMMINLYLSLRLKGSHSAPQPP